MDIKICTLKIEERERRNDNDGYDFKKCAVWC